jgi:hypothetical protein
MNNTYYLIPVFFVHTQAVTNMYVRRVLGSMERQPIAVME